MFVVEHIAAFCLWSLCSELFYIKRTLFFFIFLVNPNFTEAVWAFLLNELTLKYLQHNIQSSSRQRSLFTSEYVSYSMVPGKAINRNDFLNWTDVQEMTEHNYNTTRNVLY